MSDKGVGNLLGEAWHLFDVTVWCAVVTLGTVLVAKESSLASASETGQSVSANSVQSAVVKTLGALVSDASAILVEGVGVVVAGALEGSLEVDTSRAFMAIVKASLALVDINKGWSNSNKMHLVTWIWSAEVSRSSVVAV